MYEGYLIEIEGMKLPKEYIDVSSYRPGEKDSILLEFEDGTHTTHRIYAKRKKQTLTFETQELPVEKYKRLMKLLEGKSVKITFYNPKTDGYDTNIFFTPKEIEENIYIRQNGEVFVKSVKIELEGV